MTVRTNARVAGITFLLYFVFAYPTMVLFEKATRAEGIPAKLSGIAQHTADIRITILFSIVCCFAALTLAVTLYAITRAVDADLARLAMLCRAGEGVLIGAGLMLTIGLVWLATSTRAGTVEAVSANTLGSVLLRVNTLSGVISAVFFAAGSTFFAWLFVRGRLIPAWLAWLGVIGSALVVVVLSLQIAGILEGVVTQVVFAPVAVYELILGPWLIFKGVAQPSPR